MAFGTSGIFGQTILDILAGTTLIDLNRVTAATDFKGAFFNNTGTPDYSASAANSAYGAGAWVVGNEKTGTNWAAKGADLGNGTTLPALSLETGVVVCFDAADVSVATVTITDVYGMLVFADYITTPVADQALCAVAFAGAPHAATAGLVTVTWPAPGATGGVFYLDL
jgi:hypothetical protein